MILLYQKFLSKLYIKKILLLFVAFELFFVGFDLMKNFRKLPDAANLQILYSVNKFLEFINYTLPLSLIFALLLAMLQIIKSNELVTLYALGVSKVRVAKPFIYIASLLTLIYIALQTLPYFVQTNQTAKTIREHGTISSTTSAIFLKSGNDYAYIKTLNPHEKSATGLKIFIIEKGELKEIIKAKKGKFQHDHWQLEDVTIIHKPRLYPNRLTEAKLKITTHKEMGVLYGFTPRIIDTLFQNAPKLTIQDTLLAIDLLGKQNLRTDKIRANLYTMVIFPLFAPIVVFGLFFLFPQQHRGSSLPLFTTMVVFGTLTIWGLLFTMSKIAQNGALSPEAAILLPIVLLAIAASVVFYRYKDR
jgi:lipopolysaccharide export system permease protein